ncbi:hypothetical protein B566_EDAN002578 [Ephemera danica]|nr:hypothetical protein B566_EDAN002578 [Ephemera danica]
MADKIDKTARLITMGSGNGGNPIWFVFWLLVLIFLGFWVGFFCAGWYVLLAPLAVCLPVLKGLTDILMQGVQFPHKTAEILSRGVHLRMTFPSKAACNSSALLLLRNGFHVSFFWCAVLAGLLLARLPDGL